MTGGDHYREAERLLEQAATPEALAGLTPDDYAVVVSTAQVHATLALAAATAHPAERSQVWDGQYGQRPWTPIPVPTAG